MFSWGARVVVFLGAILKGWGDCWLFRHLAVENEDLQMLFGCAELKIRWAESENRCHVAELGNLPNPSGPTSFG